MNSLLEPLVIEELYKASKAGGRSDPDRARCLRTAFRRARPLGKHYGAIDCRAISGTLQAFYFYADGQSRFISPPPTGWTYLPARGNSYLTVPDRALKKRVIDEAFTFALRDNQQAWVLQPDGRYTRLKNRRAAFGLNQHLMQLLGKKD